LTAGASLRKAAEFVGCDPQSIRREAQRNAVFGEQLAKAKSGARVEPLLALRAAAQSDWRAAVAWMKCVDPERYARASSNTITKREANQFVDRLVESIDNAVSDPGDREKLFQLLVPAMPPAMRRRWEEEARDRAMIQVTNDVAEQEEARELQEMHERMERDARRRKLREQLSDYLTPELCKALKENEDLLDPSEFFARRGGWRKTDPKKDGSNLPAHLKFKPKTIGAEKYGPELYHEDWKKFSRVPDSESANPQPEDSNLSPDDVTSASEDIASPRRNSADSASPHTPNL
jgi:hypothetical protein